MSKATDLEALLHTLVAESMDEAGKYIESKGRLIQRPIQARIAPVLAQVEADRKKHELLGAIKESERHTDAWGRERTKVLKQELESYEYRHQSS